MRSDQRAAGVSRRAGAVLSVVRAAAGLIGASAQAQSSDPAAQAIQSSLAERLCGLPKIDEVSASGSHSALPLRERDKEQKSNRSEDLGGRMMERRRAQRASKALPRVQRTRSCRAGGCRLARIGGRADLGRLARVVNLGRAHAAAWWSSQIDEIVPSSAPGLYDVRLGHVSSTPTSSTPMRRTTAHPRC